MNNNDNNRKASNSMDFDAFDSSNFNMDHFNGLMTPNYDLIMNRRRGSSAASWMSNNSNKNFNFGAITPLNINPPSSSHTQFVIDSTTTNTNTPSKSAMNPSSLSTVSSIDTAMLDGHTQDFVRSAPAPNQNDLVHATWDEALNAMRTPTAFDIQNMKFGMELDAHITDEEKTEIPEFMKSSFYGSDENVSYQLPSMKRRSSIESMASLHDPNQPAPQSAPPTQFPGYPDQGFPMFAHDEWSGMVNNAFGVPQPIPSSNSNVSFKEPAPLTVTESDIFGNEKDNQRTRARNWSNFTTESENEPIINLVKMNGKRGRGKSLSDGDMHYLPPRQKMKIENNTGNMEYLPPMVSSMNISNPHSHSQIIPPPLPPPPKKRGRGRPRKSAPAGMRVSPNTMKKSKSKYAGLKKAEREKLRRKELKEGYSKLTDLLGLRVERAGAALPDRSVIVAAACDEIKRLEQELFRAGMYKGH